MTFRDSEPGLGGQKIDAAALVTDLKEQLKAITADLQAQAHDSDVEWSRNLHDEHERARERGRTALTWSAWVAGEVDQAAVAWLVANTFMRFCEDNQLLDGLWIAGPGDRLDRAVDNETAYYAEHPTHNARDWLKQAFGALADLPAGRGLVSREHNPVWRAPISAEAASALVAFWRRRDDSGRLAHDFTDPDLSTRFLGDVYQDLSEHARSTYALLQTPEFVEEFILDQTLTPAIEEFGLTHLRLIDPTCGSGHFLLGSFERLAAEWRKEAPNVEPRTRVQDALDSIHGVDLNPFAVAITRFRLTVAALKAIGERSLVNAPAFEYHVAIGDSLLAAQGEQGTLDELNDEEFVYASEDVGEYGRILEPGRYHVVVGNPPYITVKDKAANTSYRKAYPDTCHRQYALSVPFAELFFRLAKRAEPVSGAGYIGQITSNSFMKREFGSKLVDFFAGGDHFRTPVDLTKVIDTSGAYIPGHGTPTVILVGRRRPPRGDAVRAVLGIRGEPGQPDDPAKGLVWTEITEHLSEPGFEGDFVSVTDLPRKTLAKHPWSLSGGASGELVGHIELSASHSLGRALYRVGFFGDSHADDLMFQPCEVSQRLGFPALLTRPAARGDGVRDWARHLPEVALLPYVDGSAVTADALGPALQFYWPFRTTLWGRTVFGGETYRSAGRHWLEWHQLPIDRGANDWAITFAFVATHNHFVLDRGGKVFNRSAPVIKLPADATEDDHLNLLGVLNSSLACFWLKQVCHDKGNGGIGGGIGDEAWEPRYEFTGTKLEEFPLPTAFPRERARTLDTLAQDLAATSPTAVPVADLPAAHERWDHLRARMIAEQEELDWEVYRLYGLIEDDVRYTGETPPLALGERAFEIALSQRVGDGAETTEWFNRHKSTPITELPDHWPDEYRKVVQHRLDLIESDRHIALLERPEHKRRWATRGWGAEQADALRDTILDRLEDPDLWRDAHGPIVRSVAHLADLVRHDETLIGALRVLAGHHDVNLVAALTSLLADEAVPAQAAHRYKTPGIVKFREWQHIWDLQRREDAGEVIDIPVPPKYKQADFTKPAYWRARGKLDVPKERFTSYPGVVRSGDTTSLLGWAGWDHAEQSLALARLLIDYPDAADEQVTGLLAGLAELEPWLHQWHADVDPTLGASPAASITTLIEAQLARRGQTRADLEAWLPETGRSRTNRAKEST